jgi:RNA polymerase sigma-70 factor (ECF subfamily)
MNSADPENIVAIVRRASLGDAEAFGVLYEAYFTKLYRYIYFRVSDKADADDLVQDVFVKAYRSFSTYTPSGTSALPFFYTIARNSIIDHYRKKKSVVVEDEILQEIPDHGVSAEEKFAEKEELQALQEHLRKLPADQQEAIVLHYINTLSNKEIAISMGKSEMAIRQLQSRGIRTLRNLLKPS